MGGGGGPGWCAKHIKSIMNIGPTFLDVPKAVSNILSAESKDVAFIRAMAPGLLDSEILDLQTLHHVMRVSQTWDSVISLIPKGGETIWGNLDWSPEDHHVCDSAKKKYQQDFDNNGNNSDSRRLFQTEEEHLKSRMVCDKPWFDRLLDQTVDYFRFGIVGGSAFNMLKGMYNSPKGERLIRGLQAVRMNAPRFGSRCAAFGGLSSVLESSMIHVRQKDDPWNSILSDAAAAGLLKMRRCRGLGPASRSALIFGSGMALLEGYLIVKNRVQSPQPDFAEVDKKQKREE
ncbi:unnamed protein product [Fraxinus pennsylvanica]|uniref:Uncharacterized protein n=1 Tax=Fraxinus pennsylvanica TaxID=56036 RepID=A0AAD2E863_9LAMI|nr:unnamed protein product [Fraxinus pennsylvanica]